MKKNKSMCVGCEDNFYNGKNPYGVEECLSYKSAKIKKSILVHVSDCPPWNVKEELRLDCFHCKQFCLLKNFSTIKKGQHKGKKCYYGSSEHFEN